MKLNKAIWLNVKNEVGSVFESKLYKLKCILLRRIYVFTLFGEFASKMFVDFLIHFFTRIFTPPFAECVAIFSAERKGKPYLCGRTQPKRKQSLWYKPKKELLDNELLGRNVAHHFLRLHQAFPLDSNELGIVANIVVLRGYTLLHQSPINA